MDELVARVEELRNYMWRNDVALVEELKKQQVEEIGSRSGGTRKYKQRNKVAGVEELRNYKWRN